MKLLVPVRLNPLVSAAEPVNPIGVVSTAEVAGGICELSIPLNVILDFVLAPVENAVPKLVGLNEDKVISRLVVALTPLPGSSGNVCNAEPERSSLKLIALAEVTAA